MSEYSIFIVNVEQHLLCYRLKKTPENMFILFIFHVHKFWRGEKQRRNVRFIILS